MQNDYASLKQKVLDAARRCAQRGVGYAQQRPVFDEVASDLGSSMTYASLALDLQQAILTCWHDLFRDGVLSWGHDLDNPGPPFFHIPDRPGLLEQSRR